MQIYMVLGIIYSLTLFATKQLRCSIVLSFSNTVSSQRNRRYSWIRDFVFGAVKLGDLALDALLDDMAAFNHMATHLATSQGSSGPHARALIL